MTQAASLAPGLARVGNWQPLLSSPHRRTTIGPTIGDGGAFATAAPNAGFTGHPGRETRS